MIAALALAMQVAVATPSTLSVRVGDRTAVIPLVETSAGPAVAPERLAPLVDAQVRTDGTGRYVLTIEGVSFFLSEQVPFAKVGADVVPLVGAPFVSSTRLHVPLQLVVELLPRLVAGTAYNPERGELLVMRSAQAVAVSAPPKAPVPERPARPRARKRIVVVDAGHGGHDPGTSGRSRTGKSLIEKDVALAVAKLLEAELERRNIEVVMTRSTDVFIPLPVRGKIANERHGDLFISVHVNASAPGKKNAASARGIETYFLAVAKTEDAQRVADMENASVRFETGAHVAKEDPLSFILNDMAENEHLRESSDLADLIQRRLTAGNPAFDRGVKQGPFRVLVTSYMPAVLVELGYASNVDDAALLLDAAHQKRMAAAIATAAMDYFAAYDRRMGIGTPP